MASIANKNNLKEIQSGLLEVGLYNLSIDGDFGDGSMRAINRLITTVKENLGVTKSIELQGVSVKNTFDLFFKLQEAMKELGFYTIRVDGIWGPGSLAGYKKLVEKYRKIENLPKYLPVWSNLVGDDFLAELDRLIVKYGYSDDAKDHLMACMYFETGGTFSPTIRNGAGAYYFGLIQFGRAAAKDMGTTVEHLITLSQVEQLEWVFKYFEVWKKRGKPTRGLEDYYLTIFYPSAIGKSPDHTIFRDGGIAYKQNKGLDTDKDGGITVGEICARLYDVYFTGKLLKNRRIKKQENGDDCRK